MKRVFFVITIILSCSSLFAQGAVPFLTLQQSPLLQGAGQIGVSVPMSDPLGFYFNPAQLGFSSRDNNLSMLTLLQKTDWLGNYLGTKLSFQTFGAAAGYNFRKNEEGIPLSIGVGYIHNKISYGTFYSFDNSVKNYDEFDCYSIGASYNYYLLFNLGFSLKPFNSVLNSYEEENKYKASGTAFDVGALIVAPVSKLFFDDLKYNVDNSSYLKPKVDFSIGYSLTNLGNKIYYIDKAQADPISRTARLGYTFNFGFDLFISENKLNAIDYSFTAEAEDILIKFNQSNNGVEYQGVFGDIEIGKHLVQLKNDQNVVVHRGHILRLFETIIVASGRFDGRGYNNYKTDGVGFSSEGIFKLLNSSIENNIIKYIANHFVIEYYNTNTFVGSGLDTNFKGLALYLKNFAI